MRPTTNILTSYAYFKDFDYNEIPALIPIADSGAFSAATLGIKITVDGLAEWAKQWKQRFKWTASLDVIGDDEATRHNWNQLTEKHGLKTIPTIHYGAPPEKMNYYADAGADLIGLGGMVGTSPNKQIRWALACFKHARKHYPQLQFHGWGATSQTIMQLPWYSIDSSSWLSGLRYGTGIIFNPATHRRHTWRLDRTNLWQQPDTINLLRDTYQADPHTVDHSDATNRHIMIGLAGQSVTAEENYFNEKHGPTHIPKWGVTSNNNKRAYHVANADPNAFKTLQTLIDERKPQ